MNRFWHSSPHGIRADILEGMEVNVHLPPWHDKLNHFQSTSSARDPVANFCDHNN